MDFVTIHNGEIELNVAIKGKGPLLLCVHGIPELWYSWRHQLDHFAERGYTAAAIDVRGYGGSSRPHPIEAYTLRTIAPSSFRASFTGCSRRRQPRQTQRSRSFSGI